MSRYNIFGHLVENYRLFIHFFVRICQRIKVNQFLPTQSSLVCNFERMFIDRKQTTTVQSLNCLPSNPDQEDTFLIKLKSILFYLKSRKECILVCIIIRFFTTLPCMNGYVTKWQYLPFVL